MTLQESLTEAATSIPRREAETLLAHLLFRDRAWLIAHSDTELSNTLLHSYQAVITRRLTNEPIQYITGHQEFYGLTFHVTPAVLIPRPETELLVEAVLKRLPGSSDPNQPLRIADIGTGSGILAITLAVHLPQAVPTRSPPSTSPPKPSPSPATTPRPTT